MNLSGGKRLVTVLVSCAMAVGLLIVSAWMLLGDDSPSASAVRILPPAESEDDTAGAVAGGSAPDTSGVFPVEPALIAVYITGEVVNPGVYEMEAGKRLNHAVAVAGGPTGYADLNRVNMAEYLTDAAKYQIPGSSGDASVSAAPHGAQPGNALLAPAPTCGNPVNINTATAMCLDTLPGQHGNRDVPGYPARYRSGAGAGNCGAPGSGRTIRFDARHHGCCRHW